MIDMPDHIPSEVDEEEVPWDFENNETDELGDGTED